MRAETDVSKQNILKTLAAAGYKTQVQTLSHFYDDYGLKADEEEGEGEEDDDEEDDEDHEMEDGSDGSGSEEDSE